MSIRKGLLGKWNLTIASTRYKHKPPGKHRKVSRIRVPGNRVSYRLCLIITWVGEGEEILQRSAILRSLAVLRDPSHSVPYLAYTG